MRTIFMAGYDSPLGAAPVRGAVEERMEKLSGRVAVVTGAASGIGLGIARAAAAEGMRLALLDVEEGALDSACRALGGEALGIRADVSDPGSLAAAAERALGRFGRIDVVCNNAGVLASGPLVESSARDWEWLVGVNLLGVAHGVRTFVPHIRAGGEGGHVVNTASIAGLSAIPGLGVYTATKHAVVALSEVLREELAPEGIGVSVLCPGGVRTRIHEAARNRPDALGGPETTRRRDPAGDVGMDPDAVGRRVLRAIRANELYVLTHAEFRASFAARAEAILAAYDRTAREPE
jgi:NAD(P)-dependent dehydrogenase (short-subunit alcohol dehydrogenase family)